MRVRAHRAWLLLPAGIGLLAGIDAGLLLLEVPAPVGAGHLPDVHGPLMVLGFLGTLIALERAVALRAAVGYAAPALLGLGGLALAARPAPQHRPGAAARRSRRAGRRARRTLAPPPRRPRGRRGARCGAGRTRRPAVGAGGCRGGRAAARRLRGAHHRGRAGRARPHPPARLGRTGARRGRCSRRERRRPARCSSPIPAPEPSGCRCSSWSAWLAPRDVARRTVRSTGQPRFCAAAMLAGYGWLAVAGARLGPGRGDDHPGRARRRRAHDLPRLRHEHGAGPRPGHPARGAAPPGALPAAPLGAPRRAAPRPCSCGWPATSPAGPSWSPSGATAPRPPCCSSPSPRCSPPPCRPRRAPCRSARRPPATARAVLTAHPGATP